ncbi:hypothetical protein E1B28_001852 [Marasmius oreades]|uniref:Uncharacterized protein n=1 Tax=Marasmius oreades TaxID=181124 RepID=A0A9P7V4E7_9AGAR|nr:uncharacterized protein E1B28_001852 [Marasmius oreades]KAG7100068.1 hypothetical protein E1B28_001852 [Marasmius oreades]
MSNTTATTRGTTKQSREGRGGRSGNRGRGRGSNPGAVTADVPSENRDIANAEAEKGEEEPVFWICAEPIKYYPVLACNHHTWHVCAPRLRALYKKKDCTFCKEPQPTVILTVSEDRQFSEYNTDEIGL